MRPKQIDKKLTPKPAALRRDRFSFFWFALVTVIAAALCLTRLGARALWQDEGETAVLAKSVLAHGVPLARIGENLVLQDAVGYDGHFRWTFHPWGQFYLAAASIGLFGTGAFAARLPFALCGVATVGLCYLFVWRNWGRTATATVCALLLALSPTFVLHARQCRYYALDALAYLCVISFAVEMLSRQDGRRMLWVLFGLALTAQFYANFGTFWIALLSVGVLSIALKATKKQAAALVKGLIVCLVLSLPGMILHRQRLFGGGAEFSLPFMAKALAHLSYLDGWFVPVWMVLAAAVVLAWRCLRGRQSTTTDRLSLGCGVLILVAPLLLAWPAPLPHVRYLIALMPPAKIVLGVILFSVFQWLAEKLKSQRAADMLVGLCALALLTTNVAALPIQLIADLPDQKTPDFCTRTRPYIRFDLAGLAWELSHDFVCPDRIRLAAVHDLTELGEIVLTNYGDLPLIFHRPDLILRGGVGAGARPVEQGRQPDLILIQSRLGIAFRDYLNELLQRQQYRQIMLSVPDMIYGNIPEPRAHLFATPEALADFWVFVLSDHADRLNALPQDRQKLVARWSEAALVK